MKFRYAPFVFLFLCSTLQAAAPADDLFQKALLTESIERDPVEAIRLYQQLLDKAGRNSPVASETRLRMAICHEKLREYTESERLYREILADPTNVSPGTLNQARANLGRLEAENLLSPDNPNAVPVQWRHRFIPSRYALILGPTLLTAQGAESTTVIALGGRYRLSALDRPLGWILDIRALKLGQPKIAAQSRDFSSYGADTASLRFNYQVSFGAVRELPHGQQKKWIPEAGLGLALTSAQIEYSNASSVGEETAHTWSPYLETGIHWVPHSIVSLLVQARYTAAPYPRSVDIATPAHSQNFNFPSATWSFGAILQIRIGHIVRERVL